MTVSCQVVLYMHGRSANPSSSSSTNAAAGDDDDGSVDSDKRLNVIWERNEGNTSQSCIRQGAIVDGNGRQVFTGLVASSKSHGFDQVSHEITDKCSISGDSCICLCSVDPDRSWAHAIPLLKSFFRTLMHPDQTSDNIPYGQLCINTSVLEIFNETVLDLLAPANARKRLAILDHACAADRQSGTSTFSVSVPNATKQTISSDDDLLTTLNTAKRHWTFRCLATPGRMTTGHVVIQVSARRTDATIQSTNIAEEEARLTVLLLGTSKPPATASANHTTTKGLAALRSVLSRLNPDSSVSSNVSPPFRDSKVTRMIKPALTGEGSMTIIAMLQDCEEINDHAQSILHVCRIAKHLPSPVATSRLSAWLKTESAADKASRLLSKVRAMLTSCIRGVGTIRRDTVEIVAAVTMSGKVASVLPASIVRESVSSIQDQCSTVQTGLANVEKLIKAVDTDHPSLSHASARLRTTLLSAKNGCEWATESSNRLLEFIARNRDGEESSSESTSWEQRHQIFEANLADARRMIEKAAAELAAISCESGDQKSVEQTKHMEVQFAVTRKQLLMQAQENVGRALQFANRTTIAGGDESALQSILAKDEHRPREGDTVNQECNSPVGMQVLPSNVVDDINTSRASTPPTPPLSMHGHRNSTQSPAPSDSTLGSVGSRQSRSRSLYGNSRRIQSSTSDQDRERSRPPRRLPSISQNSRQTTSSRAARTLGSSTTTQSRSQSSRQVAMQSASRTSQRSSLASALGRQNMQTTTSIISNHVHSSSSTRTGRERHQPQVRSISRASSRNQFQAAGSRAQTPSETRPSTPANSPSVPSALLETLESLISDIQDVHVAELGLSLQDKNHMGSNVAYMPSVDVINHTIQKAWLQGVEKAEEVFIEGISVLETAQADIRTKQLEGTLKIHAPTLSTIRENFKVNEPAYEILAAGFCKHGQLGHGVEDVSARLPMPVKRPSGQMAAWTHSPRVAAGWRSSLLATCDDTLARWGFEESESSRSADTQSNRIYRPRRFEPSAFPPGIQIVSVSAGWQHSLALSQTGVLFSWGWTKFGNTGISASISSSSSHSRSQQASMCISNPTVMQYLLGEVVVGMTCGSYSSHAWTHSGKVFSWGWNCSGQLGLGDRRDRTEPCLHQLQAPVQKVAAGHKHTLLLFKSGTLSACGDGQKGALGFRCHTFETSFQPVYDEQGQLHTWVRDIAAGFSHSLLVDSAGTLMACGRGPDGETGLGGIAECHLFMRIPLLGNTRCSSVQAGGYHSAAISERGHVIVFGRNEYCQLGCKTDDAEQYEELHWDFDALGNVVPFDLEAEERQKRKESLAFARLKHSSSVTQIESGSPCPSENFGITNPESRKDMFQQQRNLGGSLVGRHVVQTDVPPPPAGLLHDSVAPRKLLASSAAFNAWLLGPDNSCDEFASKYPIILVPKQQHPIVSAACGHLHSLYVIDRK